MALSSRAKAAIALGIAVAGAGVAALVLPRHAADKAPSRPSAQASAPAPPPAEAVASIGAAPAASAPLIRRGPPPAPDPAARAAPKPRQPQQLDCPAGATARSDAPAQDVPGFGCLRARDGAPATREGEWIVYGKDGRVSQGRYADGVMIDEWRTWYPSGTLAEMQHYDQQGALDGKQLEWLPTGQRFAVRHYAHGALDGNTTLTFADGRISEEFWRHGARTDDAGVPLEAPPVPGP